MNNEEVTKNQENDQANHPEQTPVAPIVQTQSVLEEPVVQDSPIPAIHTLEGDLFAAMKDEDYGNNIVKIVTNTSTNTNARFADKKEGVETMDGDRKDMMKKYIKYVVLGTIVLIGAGVAVILYMNGKQAEVNNGGVATSTATSTPVIRVISSINPEVFKKLDVQKLDRNGFIKELNTLKVLLRDSKIATGTNVGITLDVDIKKFLEKIRYSGPDSLIRSFGDDYIFGLFTDRTKTFEPYLLVRVNSYDLAFAGILEWEPYMPGDLGAIFVKEKFVAPTATSTTASTTATTTSIKPSSMEKKFTDQVVKNIDVRIYKDENLNLTIVYGFINKEYLLIAGGEDSFINIRNKLLSKNILR